MLGMALLAGGLLFFLKLNRPLFLAGSCCRLAVDIWPMDELLSSRPVLYFLQVHHYKNILYLLINATRLHGRVPCEVIEVGPGSKKDSPMRGQALLWEVLMTNIHEQVSGLHERYSSLECYNLRAVLHTLLVSGSCFRATFQFSSCFDSVL